MSKLQELIQRLCPDGVEYKKLGEVCKKTKNIKWKDNPTKECLYIDLSSVDCETHSLSNQLTSITAETAPSRAQQIVETNDVLFGTTRPTLMRFAIVPQNLNGHICSTGYAVLRANSEIVLPQFLYFILNTHQFYSFVENNQEGAGYPSISFSRLQNFPIPVPPMEVQEEIVKILDRFAVYAAELQAELQARKEQYEYYRNLLLTFNPTGCAGGVDDEQKGSVTSWGGHSYPIHWKTMGEIGTFIRGNGLQKKDFIESGVGCIHYGQIYTYYGTFATETKSFVSPEMASKLLIVNPGNLVIACTSENVEDVGKAVAWLGNNDIVTGGHSVVFRHNINPKYVAYFFQTQTFFAQKKRYAYGAKVIDIKTEDLAKIVIPVPPLELQEKIVAVLDRFETLVNDLSEGLPAEIAAVKEQYEYYRNRLLTFKEKSA